MFFRAVKWIPVLFIVAVIAWSYYAYVLQLCFCKLTFVIIFVVSNTSNHSHRMTLIKLIKKFTFSSYGWIGRRKSTLLTVLSLSIHDVYLVVLANGFYSRRQSSDQGMLFEFYAQQFNSIFRMNVHNVQCLPFVWNLVFNLFELEQFHIPSAEMERLHQADNPSTQKRILEVFAKDLPISNRTMNGSLRYCDKCLVIKPDRAHHCSVCGQCVLKMDHHCPWVNNCVNFTNYKYFVLFLGYGLLYCIYVAATVLKYFILFWRVSEWPATKVHTKSYLWLRKQKTM